MYLYTTPSQWIDDITLTYDIQVALAGHSQTLLFGHSLLSPLAYNQPNGDASVNYEIAVANASSSKGEEGNLIPESRPATPAATQVRLISGNGVVVAQSAQLNGSLVVPRGAWSIARSSNPF